MEEKTILRISFPISRPPYQIYRHYYRLPNQCVFFKLKNSAIARLEGQDTPEQKKIEITQTSLRAALLLLFFRNGESSAAFSLEILVYREEKTKITNKRSCNSPKGCCSLANKVTCKGFAFT